VVKAKKPVNPFYVLLVVVGVAFVITSCAYGVMAYRDVSLGGSDAAVEDRGLIGFMDRHGMMLLGVEVGLLGVLTVGAIGTDDYWRRRLAKAGESSAPTAQTPTAQDDRQETGSIAETGGGSPNEG